MGDLNEDARQKASIDFMLAEYKHHVDEFRRSEELGESRVNLFLAIVAAVFTGGAFALMKAIPGEQGTGLPYYVIYFIISCALCVTFLFGYVTLVRLVHRNLVSHQELRASGRIRRYFWENCPEIRNYLYYKPYDDQPIRKLAWKLSDPLKTFRRGGLVETIMLVNAIIAGTLVVTVALTIIESPTAKTLLSQSWISWLRLIGIVSGMAYGFHFALIRQFSYVETQYKAGEPKDDEKKFPEGRDRN